MMQCSLFSPQISGPWSTTSHASVFKARQEACEEKEGRSRQGGSLCRTCRGLGRTSRRAVVEGIPVISAAAGALRIRYTDQTTPSRTARLQQGHQEPESSNLRSICSGRTCWLLKETPVIQQTTRRKASSSISHQEWLLLGQGQLREPALDKHDTQGRHGRDLATRAGSQKELAGGVPGVPSRLVTQYWYPVS